MKIAYIQTSPELLDVDSNLRRALELMKKCIGADVVVLPELFSSGYMFQTRAELESVAEEVPTGPASEFLAYAAKKMNALVVGGLPERAGDKVYNSAPLFSPDGHLGTYRKLHLFNEEKNIFDMADDQPFVIDYRGVKIGALICFDWIFPEIWRRLALDGAQLILHPSNLVLPKKCQRGMPARAMENRIFCVTCNRVGSERGVTFTGGSLALDPEGETLASSAQEGEDVQVFQIKPELALQKMITGTNHVLDDRRPEFYP